LCLLTAFVFTAFIFTHVCCVSLIKLSLSLSLCVCAFKSKMYRKSLTQT